MSGTGVIKGNCDVSASSIFKGWVFDSSGPGRRLELDVLLNGERVRTIVADQFREDLQISGIGDGRHAFVADVPLEAVTGLDLTAEFVLSIRSTGQLLAGSARTIDLVEAPMTFAHLRQMADILLDARLDKGLARANDVTIAQRGTLRPSSKIALFAVNARGLLISHQRIMADLRLAGYAIVVINSDERFGRSWLELPEDTADTVILKRDEGRDFSSWLTAYHLLRHYLESADHVLFINESLCGPIRPLSPLLEAASKSGVGFWGLSDSYDVKYHLQSSLFILSQTALCSRAFREFVASYAYPNDKRAVIDQGEIALSACLLSGGITSDVLCRYETLCDIWMSKYHRRLDEISELITFLDDDGRFDEVQRSWLSRGHVEHWIHWIENVSSSILAGEPRNAQHVFWRLMIEEFNYPFIKRELLFVNPSNVPDLGVLFRLVSDDDREFLLAEIRQQAGRAPPLRKIPRRSSYETL